MEKKCQQIIFCLSHSNDILQLLATVVNTDRQFFEEKTFRSIQFYNMVMLFHDI